MEEIQPLKMAKAFTDIIVQQCPNFYELYDRKKSEYNALVYILDRNSLGEWSNACQCDQ